MSRKYQPSNGTEGMMFMENYCEQCLHEKWIHTQNDNDLKCEILSNTMIYTIKDKEYPSEWIYNENEKPTCTKFKKWDWDNNDGDDLNEPPESPTDDPNQLMLFSIADDILENHIVKETELISTSINNKF